MILYIFNETFFYNGGFSKRCQREVKILSQHEKVIVISREEKIVNQAYVTNNLEFAPFFTNCRSIETTKKYSTGFYEIFENMKLLFPLLKKVYQVARKYSDIDKELKIYVISSPMTVPLFCLFIIKFLRIKDSVLEFHDLEPEMAIHIKKLKRNSFVLKIEYFLEKLLCQQYAKIIVTNAQQAKILIARNGIVETKIFVFPNTVSKEQYQQEKKTKIVRKKKFIIGYISTFRFGYTFLGLCEFIEKMNLFFKKYQDIEFVIIGNGEGMHKIKATIAKYNLETQVVILGNITDVSGMLSTLDVGIIPWIQEGFSDSILPTKLFEYLAAEVAVIVPDFGVFPEIIKNNENGLLFSTINDLVQKVVELKEDSKKRNILAKNGYTSYIHSYSLNHYTKEYRAFLHL